MALQRGLNPDVVKTSLDELFFTIFDKSMAPQVADVTEDAIFRQGAAYNAAVQTQVMNDGGTWGETAELQNVPEATPLTGTKRTFSVATFKQDVPISYEYMEDDMWGTVSEMVRKMALKARVTQRENGFGLYNGAFTTTLTNEGATLISDTHTTISGATVDNKLAGTLDDSVLNAAIVSLRQQKDQSGDIVGFSPACLLVPSALFQEACVLVDSEFRPGTNENDANVYSSKYNIMVKQSPYLSADAGGSDTAWFLLSDLHSVHRWVRQGITTEYVDPKYSGNDVAKYRGRFREVYGAPSYEGLVGGLGV